MWSEGVFTPNGIAYQFLPSGLQFNAPVDVNLLHNGKEFSENGIKVYKYEDDVIQGACTYTVLDQVSEKIDSMGGVIELDDAKLTISEGALSSRENIVIKKINLDCNVEEVESKLNVLVYLVGGVFVLILIILIAVLKIKKSQSRSQLLSVEEYIANNLKRGYTEEKIRKVLLNQGWKKEQLDKTFRDASKFMKK